MAETETTLTKATHDRLVLELEDLTTRGRIEIASQIEAARALGDLSENGDYHAAKDAQGKMESRIRHLQRLLKTARVVDDDEGGDGSVRHGVVVALRYEGDDEDDVQRYFVGSIEERGVLDDLELDAVELVDPVALADPREDLVVGAAVAREHHERRAGRGARADRHR